MKQAFSKRRALCVWIPHWPLQRLTNARAKLKNGCAQRPAPCPLVLYNQPRQGIFQVVACSKSAAEKGILPGMPLAEARALANVRLEQHDPAADRETLVDFAGWCEQFSPVVGVEDPDCLFLDITGLAPLFGSEQALAEQVERAFGERGFMVRLAVADTFGLAWALAHCSSGRLAVLPSEQSHATLAALPIPALRLPENTIAMLAELGVTRIGQLLAIPRDTLAARFDAQLILRLDQATGSLPETIATEHPAPEITAHVRLEIAAEDRKEVDFWLAELIEQIAASLSKRQQGLLRLACEFRCQFTPPVPMLVSLYQPTANPRHLFDLTRLQLDHLKFPGPVEEIRLAVLLAARLASHQLELFQGEHKAGDQRQLALLIDRLSNRLGPAAVASAQLLPDAQPEYACRYEPKVGQISNLPKSETKRRQAKKTSPPPTLKERPLLLEPNPIPLAVLSVVPNGPPIRFHWQGAWQRVAKSWGPERIETGWWRGRQIHRNYYRVETTTVHRFWLFRHGDGKWFLHGIFA